MSAYDTALRAQVLERCRKMEATLLRLRSDAVTAACVRARAIGEMLGSVSAQLGRGDARVPELIWWLERSQYLFDIDIDSLHDARG